MEKHRHEFEVSCMCDVFNISRSGFYSWRKRRPSSRALEEQSLTASIIASHSESRRTYGSPRVLKDLQAAGKRVSRKRVARIMRENRLFSIHKKRFRVTTESEHQYPIAENLLKRDFLADAPNRKWASDITFVWTSEGWMYLAVVIDLY